MKKIISSLSISLLLLTSCANNAAREETSSDTTNKTQAVTTQPGEGSAIITTSDYKKMVNSSPIVLVDFSATWCGPCKKLAPRLDELVNDMPGKFTLVKSDVDRDAALADSFNIMNIPTLMLYKNGVLQWRSEGLVEKEVIAGKITEAEKQ